MLNSSFIVHADGDNYEIDQVSISAWRYWMNHITNNQQYTNVDTENYVVSGASTQELVLHYDPSNTTVTQENNEALESLGCTLNRTWYPYQEWMCPALSSAQMESLDSKYYYFYHLPLLTGTITQPTAYSTADRIFQSNGLEYLYAFYVSSNISGSNGIMTIHNSDGTNTSVNVSNSGFTNNGGIFFYRWTGNGMWGTLDIPYLNSKSYNISPIYLGRTNYATNDILQMLGLEDHTVQAINQGVDDIESDLMVINNTLTVTNTRLNTINSSINSQTTTLGGKLDTLHTDQQTTNTRLSTIIERITNGTSSSQEAVNDNNDITEDFVDSSDTFHNAEVQQLNSMDTNLQNITTTGGIIQNSKFLSTANWVTVQFNRIVNNTPFELVITFGLILGLALVFIGKVR